MEIQLRKMFEKTNVEKIHFYFTDGTSQKYDANSKAYIYDKLIVDTAPHLYIIAGVKDDKLIYEKHIPMSNLQYMDCIVLDKPTKRDEIENE